MSLLANINVSKVATGNANKIQSNRLQNPDSQMCPVWNGMDLAGRPVCLDSFNTKNAGCNSSLDRIKVENFLRPSYANYVTQSASGIQGIDADYGSNIHATDTAIHTADKLNRQMNTGKFGLVSGAESVSRNDGNRDLRASNAYQNTQDQSAQMAEQRRVAQRLGINEKNSRLNNSTPVIINQAVQSPLNRNRDYIFTNTNQNQNGNYLSKNRMNHYADNNTILV